jgi:hypothetical protein
MMKVPILLMGTDKMLPSYVYEKSFTVRFPDRSESREGYKPDRKGGLIWYTDGSKTNKGTGAGVYCEGTRRKRSFSLGRYTTVFQAELYAIKACAEENIDRNSRNRNIYILSDRQHLRHLTNTRLTLNYSGTVTRPSKNWLITTGYNLCGCRGMRV